jgi:hypothetical protein
VAAALLLPLLLPLLHGARHVKRATSAFPRFCTYLTRPAMAARPSCPVPSRCRRCVHAAPAQPVRVALAAALGVALAGPTGRRKET